jgi:tellurite resistance protein
VAEENKLKYMPVAFFAVVMGLSGLSVAWRKAGASLPWAEQVSLMIMALAIGIFIVLLGFFFARLAAYTELVASELSHPMHMNFYPAISICLLLISIMLLRDYPSLAEPLWIMGAALHFIFTLFVISTWIHHAHFEITHINPAWFIPAVGNVLVPVAGAQLGFLEISWFFFSVGIFFWIILMPIVFYRMLFHEPLPGRLLPTLFIMIAPPTVGLISYIGLGGEYGDFARMLYYIGLFLTFLLLSQARRFVRLDFFLSWWAYSFPLAAVTIATFLMHELSGALFFLYLAYVFLAIASLVIAILAMRTIVAMKQGKICQSH